MGGGGGVVEETMGLRKPVLRGSEQLMFNYYRRTDGSNGGVRVANPTNTVPRELSLDNRCLCFYNSWQPFTGP